MESTGVHWIPAFLNQASRPSKTGLASAMGPEACGLGLAGAGRQNRDRSVVDKDCLTRQHMPPDGIRQRRKQGGGFARPIGQCRAVDIEPVAVEDLALPIQR